MANYSLVINSRFRPFEYQELLAPVLMATQAHQALEEAYGNLDTEAAVWDRRTEGSEKAHSLYTNFSRDLASAAETLSKYGLTPQSRRTMLNMRSRYASDITPIMEAWTKRQADIKAQQEAMLRDPYHAFNRVAADTSLDTYLDNPNIDVLSENASGAVLAAQVRAMAGDIKNYIDNRNIDKLEKLGLPYQYIQKIIHGATADQVLKTMQGDPEAAPFLHSIVETVMKGSGVRDWSSMNGDWVNNPIYKRLENQAMTGLTAAIGTTELKNYTDSFSMQDAINARQHARAVAEQKRRERVAEGERAEKMKMYDISPTSYYSKSEIAAINNKTVKELDSWRKAGYFSYDGKLTERGYKALQYVPSKKTGTRYIGHTSGTQSEVPVYSRGTGNYQFYQWATRHGVTNVKDKATTAKQINKYYQNTRRAVQNGELATGNAKLSAYRQRLYSKEARGVMADNITSALGNDGVIYKAGSLGKNNTISNGEGIKGKKFKELVADTPILYVMNVPTAGQYGQQLIELTNGEKYILPSGILSDYAQTAINNANVKVRNANNIAEVATNLNQANFNLASMLTTTDGADIKPNDGTMLIGLE